ncbi:MAG: hypothetical protein NW215_08745 [Hyphomicrobiales bacterium]|nr:hypothetical protein [Hyphomicrobiales bacterium]
MRRILSLFLFFLTILTALQPAFSQGNQQSGQGNQGEGCDFSCQLIGQVYVPFEKLVTNCLEKPVACAKRGHTQGSMIDATSQSLAEPFSAEEQGKRMIDFLSKYSEALKSSNQSLSSLYSDMVLFKGKFTPRDDVVKARMNGACADGRYETINTFYYSHLKDKKYVLCSHNLSACPRSGNKETKRVRTECFVLDFKFNEPQIVATEGRDNTRYFKF